MPRCVIINCNSPKISSTQMQEHIAYHRTSVAYSRLDWEDEPPPANRRPSVHFIPEGRAKKALLILALILGTTITIFYRRQPIYHEDIRFRFVPDTNELSSIQGDIIVDDTDNKLQDISTTLEDTEDAYDNITTLGIAEEETKSQSSKPNWTWTCKDNRCQRAQAAENSTIQSLKTCSMLCLESPLWPEPTITANIIRTIVPVDLDKFSLEIVKSTSEDVTEHINGAFELFKKDIAKFNINGKAGGKKLLVRVKVVNDKDPRLLLSTTEGYTLKIETKDDTVYALAEGGSFVGARHALQTLTQLIWFDSTRQSLVAYETAYVEDAPEFSYRGQHLDTARNFFPVEDIIRTLDAMAASKLNTFHWHATDSQSFPLKLNSVPELALYGAYSRREVYTVEDVKAIVRHARLRGIRVVIEIDAPAHVGRAWSWGQTQQLGDLAYCVEAEPWMHFCGEPPCGQLNPNNKNVYEILKKIYKEIIELTGVDDVFHLGGDEVNQMCWMSNMDTMEVRSHLFSFMQNAWKSLQEANKGKIPEMTIIWSSPFAVSFLENLKLNYTVQLWGGDTWKDIKKIPNSGVPSIVSHVNAWYLDCGFGSWRDDGESVCTYNSWQVAYNHRPWRKNIKKSSVVGGTACMWSEQVGPEGLDAKLWPRAAAFAERLWTDPEREARTDDIIRLDLHRQRLVDSDITAEPILPQWCIHNPYECE